MVDINGNWPMSGKVQNWCPEILLFCKSSQQVYQVGGKKRKRLILHCLPKSMLYLEVYRRKETLIRR